MFQRIMLCSACSPRFGPLALEDEGNTILQNIKNCLPSDSHSPKNKYSANLPWETQISQGQTHPSVLWCDVTTNL